MKDKKYKIIILIVVIIFILILSLIGVYSFFGWQSKDSLVDVTVSSGTGSCTLLSDNNKALEPVSSKEEGRIIKFNGRQEMAPKGLISWNMTINNINNLKHNSFKYELVNETTGVSYKSGDFSTINNGSVIRFQNSEKLSYNTNNTYTLYLWIDGTMGNNPLSMAGSNIDFDMNCEVAPPQPTLVEHITNLYNNAPKSNVTNNNISYHYADSVSLMNDRLGGTTQGLDDGNIRYYGASPNNSIYLPTKAGGKDKYRIIGLFKSVELANGTKKDLIKVIRDTSIGNYSWDTSVSSVNSGSGINQWGASTYTDVTPYEGADLMRLLNPSYSGTNGSLWWNGTSSVNCYNNSNNANGACNFASTGLNSSIQSKIENVVWHMGRFASNKIYSDDAYIMERGDKVGSSSSDKINRTSTWTGKVALMSPSDYGYAVNFNSCTGNLSGYSTGNCSVNNWLKNSSYQWLLAPSSYTAVTVWAVTSSGYVSTSDNASNARGVRPAFYLSSELSVVSGDGSSSKPYEIK